MNADQRRAERRAEERRHQDRWEDERRQGERRQDTHAGGMAGEGALTAEQPTDEQQQALRVWALEELRRHIFTLSALLDQQSALGRRVKRLEDYMEQVTSLLAGEASPEHLHDLWRRYQRAQATQPQEEPDEGAGGQHAE
ncbi:MAG: hypothetical protein M3347_07470 [Armatimonadota bacterium]|nr:hypothetical protein [Armatimonadota bacterium]